MNFTPQFKLIIIIFIVLFSTACNGSSGETSNENGGAEIGEANDPYNYITSIGNQDISISGSEFQVRTDNCGASVSARETLSRSRSFNISLEADVSTSLGGEFEGDVLVAGAKVQAAIETSLGIQIGTTETVNAERTLETPADSFSIITLQWEEVWSTGNVNIIDEAGNLEGQVPFRALTTLRLSQKSVDEVPCTTEPPPNITNTATITQIPPTETPILATSSPSPINTPTLITDVLDGNWDFNRQKTQRIDGSGRISESSDNDDIILSLIQNGSLITGEILGTTGSNTCNNARINGEIQGNNISWTMEFFGTCCPGALNKFKGTVIFDGDSPTIIGEQEPIGRPPSGCYQSWAILTGTKQE